MKWVLLTKLSELTGYSEPALRQKIVRGDLILGVHYIKSPDERIQINLEAYYKWVEGQRLELNHAAKAA